jgi:GxxExxY protein
MTKLLHKDLTGTIIGAYFEVYNHTSRTYPEHIYEQAMLEELRLRDIDATSQEKFQILYKDRLVGSQQLDVFIAQKVVVENKVAEQLTPLHKAQCLSYVKTVDKLVGLLFNFGGSEPEFSRVYFNPAKKASSSPENKLEKEFTPPAEWLYPDLSYQIVDGLYEVHTILGAGFIYRIYANACSHELGLRGLAVKRTKRMQVAYKGKIIGDIAFAHIIVEGKVMVFPVAIHHIEDIRLDDLKRWMRLAGIQLGIVANFDAIHLEVVFVRA